MECGAYANNIAHSAHSILRKNNFMCVIPQNNNVYVYTMQKQ